ncbi:hypothetical protein CN692_14195 [Bacillus sp. AFS002410]|uniref:hypothetical protein n=1 Tax=Bacillus sp. AFS002410 TaxID=2033481 RepID=UPI000BEF2B45|nr:hypothetical protein [Bacillus sp. AFS002410]PEJ57045.1 hypothetical protein CN692_14195 [Bacillus sp. AFS002410]
MRNYAFDTINKVTVKLKNGKAINEIEGTEEEYDEIKYYNQYVEITESSYDLLTSNLVIYFATNNESCLKAINKELRKYGE